MSLKTFTKESRAKTKLVHGLVGLVGNTDADAFALLDDAVQLGLRAGGA
jgi:hypothetical protein